MFKPNPLVPRGRKLDTRRKNSAPTLTFLFVAYFLFCVLQMHILKADNKQNLFKLILSLNLLEEKKGSMQTVNSLFIMKHMCKWNSNGLSYF